MRFESNACRINGMTSARRDIASPVSDKKNATRCLAPEWPFDEPVIGRERQAAAASTGRLIACAAALTPF